MLLALLGRHEDVNKPHTSVFMLLFLLLTSRIRILEGFLAQEHQIAFKNRTVVLEVVLILELLPVVHGFSISDYCSLRVKREHLYIDVRLMYNFIMLSVTVTEARARMREVLAHVKAGEEVEFSQNGQVVAVLVHPSRLRRPTRTPNTLAAEQLMTTYNRLKQGKSQHFESLQSGRSEELVKELQLERDSWDG